MANSKEQHVSNHLVKNLEKQAHTHLKNERKAPAIYGFLRDSTADGPISVESNECSGRH